MALITLSEAVAMLPEGSAGAVAITAGLVTLRLLALGVAAWAIWPTR